MACKRVFHSCLWLFVVVTSVTVAYAQNSCGQSAQDNGEVRCDCTGAAFPSSICAAGGGATSTCIEGVGGACGQCGEVQSYPIANNGTDDSCRGGGGYLGRTIQPRVFRPRVFVASSCTGNNLRAREAVVALDTKRKSDAGALYSKLQ
jgi:hypothetical protein